MIRLFVSLQFFRWLSFGWSTISWWGRKSSRTATASPPTPSSSRTSTSPTTRRGPLCPPVHDSIPMRRTIRLRSSDRRNFPPPNRTPRGCIYGRRRLEKLPILIYRNRMHPVLDTFFWKKKLILSVFFSINPCMELLFCMCCSLSATSFLNKNLTHHHPGPGTSFQFVFYSHLVFFSRRLRVSIASQI